MRATLELAAYPDDDPWRQRVLSGLLYAAVVLGAGVLAIVALSTPGRGYGSVQVSAFGYALIASALLVPTRHLRWRAGLLLAGLYATGTLVYLRVGYLSGPTLCYALVAVATGLFFGARATAGVLVGLALSLLLCGLLFDAGWVGPPAPAVLEVTHWDNWARVAVVFSLIAGMLAIAVTHVVRSIETSLLERSAALEQLRHEHAELARMQRQLEDAQHALQQSQKMEAVGQLAGGVAHDFNNLLTVILGYAHELVDLARGHEDAEVAVREIQVAGGRASELTRRLLSFSRARNTHAEDFDLNVRVRDTERMLSRIVGDEIEVKVDLDSAPCPVRADPGQLEQVLVNLVLNAAHAMPGGGGVAISTRADAADGPSDATQRRWVRLRVRDEGVGMSPEVQARIFEPFFTTRPAGAGTGLGLSTAQGIVEGVGGEIAVQSEPGRGSCFDVWLPLRDEPASQQAVPPQRPEPRRGRGETLLVVEDEGAVRSRIVGPLRRHGYRVIEAGDGVDALERLRQGRGVVDMVVSDVSMPRLGGGELVRALRQEWPKLPVLLVSGHPVEAQAARQSEGVPLLAKPFTPDELLDAVGRALEAAPPLGTGADPR